MDFDGFSMVFGPKLSAKRPEHLQKVFLDLKFDSGSIYEHFRTIGALPDELRMIYG